MKQRFFFRLFGAILLFFVLVWLMTPTPLQAQLMNAITKAMLQTGTFALSGIYKFTGATFLPSGSTLPGTCDASISGAKRFFYLTTDNRIYFCTATNTWTSIGGIPNPFTLNQDFSGIVNFTGTTDIKRQQTVEVCKSGCTYSTVTAALAAITDNAVTKRYSILVHPGDYDELITAKSYVTVIGTNKVTTRLRGNGSATATISINVGITGVGFQSITIGGSVPVRWFGNDIAARTQHLFSHCILGIVDGTELTNKSQDCLHEDVSPSGGHDVVAIGNICRTRFDGHGIGKDSTLIDMNGEFELSGNTGTAARMYFTSTNSGGSQLYSNGMTVTGDSTNSTGFAILDLSIFTTASTVRQRIYRISNATVSLSGVGAPSYGINIATLPVSALGGEITFDDVTFDTLYTGNPAVNGIFVQINDANLAQWRITWNGGRIRSTTTGAFTDVTNNANQAGFVLGLANVVHAGTYAGTGTLPDVLDTIGGRFGISLFPPTANLAVGACINGELKFDTGGATKELCWCNPANTWNCANLVAGGPVD